MEVKELMINDLVWYVDEPIKVKHNYGKSIRYDDSKFSHEVEQSYIKPIPLTEDIIKLNGFRYTEFQDGMFSFKREWIIIDDNNKYHTFVIRIVGANEYMVFDYVKIKYVHDLQHALHLYGFSELANSFKIKEDQI